VKKLSHTVLIIPPNDAEAILIKQIADAMGIPLFLSRQTHGASLDKGHDYVVEVKKGGYTRAVVVEMPGPKAEAHLKRMGVELVIIDHHHYTGLDRAHDPKTGRMLPSSLEQFLAMFRITEKKLRALGFDPLLVQGIGAMDRGFVWALQDEGYTKAQMKKVLAFHDGLLEEIHNQKTEQKKNEAALRAWKSRKRWRGYFIVETRADIQLRPRLSRLVALKLGRPTPLIIVEHGRGLIYVQESDKAMVLFDTFGGFTFGLDRNWGYRNESGKPRVTLRRVQKVLDG